MEFAAGLFLGLTFWAWAIIIVEMILLIAFIEVMESGATATVSVAVAAVLLWLVGGVNVFAFVYHHPFQSLLYALGYVVVGLAYSFFRWDWLVARWRDEYDDADDAKKRHMFDDKPQAKHSKGRIIAWMSYWPWSAFWWIFADFITELFQRIYRRVAKFYDVITNRRLKDLPEPPADTRGARSR